VQQKTARRLAWQGSSANKWHDQFLTTPYHPEYNRIHPSVYYNRILFYPLFKTR
jgi:hypothetical protein